MCFVTVDTRLKRKLLFICLAIAVTAVLAVVLSFCISDSPENAGRSFDLKETGGVSGFLSQFSLNFQSQVSSRELTLPSKDDEILVEYQKLQSQIGLNILKFSGKRVEERYLKLKNKNSSGQRLYAVIYIYNEEVIAAHLTTLQEGAQITAFV